MSERNYTVAQLAQEWGVDPSTLYKMIKRGELGCLYIGGAIRIRPAQREAYESLNTHDALPCPEKSEPKPSTTHPAVSKEEKVTTLPTRKTAGQSAFQRGQMMSKKPIDTTVSF